MCMDSRGQMPKVADKNITVYKVFVVRNGYAQGPFNNCQCLHIGKAKRKMKKSGWETFSRKASRIVLDMAFSKKAKLFPHDIYNQKHRRNLQGGWYAFVKKEEALSRAHIDGERDENTYGAVVIACIIKKGTPYIQGRQWGKSVVRAESMCLKREKGKVLPVEFLTKSPIFEKGGC